MLERDSEFVMIIGENLGGIDNTVDYIFKELLTVDIWWKLIEREVVRPQPGADSTKSKLAKSFMDYTKNFYPKTHRIEMINMLLQHVENEVKTSINEPSRKEDELKVPAKNALREERYTIYDKEIPIGHSRADVVGYKKKYTPTLKKRPRTLGSIKLPLQEEYRGREFEGYEFCGIELKTAKRDKDSLFRQIINYIEHFHHSFTAITPFSFLSDFDLLKDMIYPECNSKGMGILLIDKNKVIGTILEAEEKFPSKTNRKYLVETMRLEH